MPVANFVQPNYLTQTASAYKAAIDAAIAVLAAAAADYACHAKDTPDMQVLVDAGQLFLVNSTLVSNAQQTSATIVAPVTNPRIDRIVINDQTGVVSVITGSEAASPSAPAITTGNRPVAQILLATSTTAITNSMITDERVTVASQFSDGIDPYYSQNIGIPVPTVDAGAMTIALQTKAFATPSVTSPVSIAFRSRTETQGTSVVRYITAATGLVVPDGARLGYSYERRWVSMTIASPCVVTASDSDLYEEMPIVFHNSGGALPTGFTEDSVVYYVLNLSGQTFNVSATPGGAAINTSGTQSGTHTIYYTKESPAYLYLCDDGATVELGIASRPLYDETKLHTTTAIGTGSDDGWTLYTTTALTDAAVRLIGRIDYTADDPLTIGTYSVAPTRVSLVTARDLVGELTVLDAEGYEAGGFNSLPSVLGGTCQVQVGDIVQFSHSIYCVGGAALFGVVYTLSLGGTARLQGLGVTGEYLYFRATHAPGVVVTNNGSTVSETRRVTKAGTLTLTTAGIASYGTAPTNQGAKTSVRITRPSFRC